MAQMKCPNCGEVFEIDENLLRISATCSKCREKITIQFDESSGEQTTFPEEEPSSKETTSALQRALSGNEEQRNE